MAAPNPIVRFLGRTWPVLVTIVIFAILFARIPVDEFIAALGRARLAPFLLVFGSFSLTFFAVDTLVLTRLLRWFHLPVAWRELLPVRASTYVVSIVNTQLAQGALGYYLHRRFGTPLGETFGTIALLILLEVTQLTIFASVGFALTGLGFEQPAVWLVPAGVLAAWAALVGASRGGLGAIGERLRRTPLLHAFREVRFGQVALLLGLKGSVFVLSLFVHWVALGTFGISVPLVHLLASLPIVYFVSALPVTVAHLGTSQAAWIFFFGAWAAEADLLAYSLASHLTFMLANGTIGLFFLPRAWADLRADVRD